MISESPSSPSTRESNEIVIEPARGLALPDLRALLVYRELLYFLVWRDLKVRYKQTALGVAWIVIQPLVSMLIYSLLFGLLLNAPSGDVPYPVFVFAGLLPWNYFAASLSRSSTSLVANTNLITKVYFPRLVIPLSSVLSGLVDFVIAFLVFIALMLIFRVPLSFSIILLPFFLLLAFLTALGVGLWLSALNVRFRDVNYLAPFLLQVWMYLTPVVYSSTLIPEPYRYLLVLNPMTAVVEGFRWALLGSQATYTQNSMLLLGFSIINTLTIIVSGFIFFHRTESSFADII
jgi:lipopolysaccharide transport system permease protein